MDKLMCYALEMKEDPIAECVPPSLASMYREKSSVREEELLDKFYHRFNSAS
jgi:hypothetical protein